MERVLKNRSCDLSKMCILAIIEILLMIIKVLGCVLTNFVVNRFLVCEDMITFVQK